MSNMEAAVPKINISSEVDNNTTINSIQKVRETRDTQTKVVLTSCMMTISSKTITWKAVEITMKMTKTWK